LRGEEFNDLEADELKGGALSHIIAKLEEGGYAVSFNLYNSANFGTPQKRERVVIICSRDGKKPPYLEPTHSEDGTMGLPKWKTFKEAVAVLAKNTEHQFVKFPEKRLKYYRMLKAGENWRALSEDLQREAMGKSYYSGGGKTGFLRRLAWDKPAPTLLTHPAMPATDLAHPSEDRPLSVQEYKVIQEFPLDWKIEGSVLDRYKQIGNAVPVGLGVAIGNLLQKLLKEEEVQNIPDFKYSRYRMTNEVTWKANFEKELEKLMAATD
jgi:DNA (cytosine-5)-methyltransferase 1